MPMQETLAGMEADDSSRKDEDFDDAMYQDDDDFSDDSSSSDDESSLGSAMDLEAERLWDALQSNPNPSSSSTTAQSPSPSQILHAHLKRLATSTAFKLEDDMVAHIRQDANATPTTATVTTLFESLLQAITGGSSPASPRIKHVILGTHSLQLFSKEQHLQLYQCLANHHASTITYWKLGTTPTAVKTTSSENQAQPQAQDEDVSCGIPTLEFWKILTQHAWPSLTEFQIRGMDLTTTTTTTTTETIMGAMVQFLQSVAPTIQLFNLLEMKLMTTTTTTTSQTPPTTGSGALLDPLFQAVGPIPKLDEVQIQRIILPLSSSSSSTTSWASSSSLPLISVETLDRLLQIKPKWWRLTLDGLGLTDAHIHVLTHHLQASVACKMNDLLSLRQNPHITPACLHRFCHTVCLNKARMGLVLSDDPSLNALVDFVRPLNNLHRRLEYKDSQGQYYSNVDQWMEWMTSLSRLPWISEARKLNYIWFTLMEQPSMIAKAIQVCSSTNTNPSTASSSEMATEAPPRATTTTS